MNEILNKFLDGMFTRKETAIRLNAHIINLLFTDHITEDEFFACGEQIDRFERSEITANDLQTYLGLIV